MAYILPQKIKPCTFGKIPPQLGRQLRSCMTKPVISQALLSAEKAVYLAIADDTGNVRLFDIKAHKISVLSSADSYKLKCLAFSADGLYLASSGEFGICVWDTKTLQLVVGWEHKSEISAISVSPGGSYVAAARAARITRSYNVKQGTMSGVTSVAFSPNGSRLVAGRGNGCLELSSSLVSSSTKRTKNIKLARVLPYFALMEWLMHKS